MKRNSIIFLQTIVIIIAVGTLIFMLWEPHLEGRNANATAFEIYFKDPFLAYAYAASILYFIALHRVFKLLRFVNQNQAFSQVSIKYLQTIKYCMIALIASVTGAMGYIIITIGGKDDIAGGVAMGLFAIIIFTVSAFVAAKFERTIKNRLEPK